MLACHCAISRKSLFNSLLKENQGCVFLSQWGNADVEHLSGLQGSNTGVVCWTWLGGVWNACWLARQAAPWSLGSRRCLEVVGGWRRRGLRGDDSVAAAKLATCRSVNFKISFSSGLQHSSLLARRVSGQKAWLKPTASERLHKGGVLDWVPAVGEEGSLTGLSGRRNLHYSLNTYLWQSLSILYHRNNFFLVS